MKKTLLLPPACVGTMLGLGIGANSMGFIPDPVWRWGWPSIIALAFLVGAVIVLLADARRWLWPLGTGFVVQTVGVFLLLAEEFESPWTTLLYSFGAVGIVLLVMLVIWLVNTIRARRMEQMMTRTDQEEIRKKMVDALRKLERAVGKRNAVYQLPWFLVFGRSAVGKTTAIKNSGIGLPMREDWLKGRGGNVTIEFFFTNEMIFLDTPGKWVMEGADEESLKNWVEVFGLLRKHRRRRPMDGLVVVVSADDLLQNTEEELHEQAGNIREVMDLIHEELNFRVPVYLLISKCDLIAGFTKFFKGLPPQRRHEILGWSNADPNRGDLRRLISRAFPKVVRHLEAYRLEMLARIASTTAARELFFFTEEFKRLEQPLGVFLDVLFQEDRYHEPPVFRGFYFTSGTQGEGSPLGQAMAELAKTLGVSAGPAKPEEEEPKRSYFLLELFRDLMVGDEGLVGRTAGHWWRRRRDTLVVAFMPAVLAMGILSLSGISLWRNYRLYDEIRTNAPVVSQQLEELTREASDAAIPKALRLTEQLRSYHRRLDTIDPFRRFGMRRPGELKDKTFRLFQQGLMGSVLRPTLETAESYATDPDRTCSDRTDVFYSVVWLRQGARRQWSDDLRGFERIWGLDEEKAAAARTELSLQFGYLLDEGPRRRSYLPGISLVRVAESIRDGCSAQGAGSPMEQYRQLQNACSQPRASEVRDCYARFKEILRTHQEDYSKLENHIAWLAVGLEAIGDGEGEAVAAQKIVEGISLPPVTANECLSRFNAEIIPKIEQFLQDDEELIRACKHEYETSRRRATIARVMQDQDVEREEAAKSLAADLDLFGGTCGQALAERFYPDPAFPATLSRSWRRNACEGIRSAAPAPRTARAPRRRPPPEFFQPPGKISSRFTEEGWRTERDRWEDERVLTEDIRIEDERADRLRQLRRRVASYAGKFAAHWNTYLASLELKPPSGNVTAWVDRLSETQEYARMFGPATNAMRAGGTDEVALYQGFRDELSGLSGLSDVVGSDQLAQYQEKLGELAEVLRRCAEDQAFWRKFQRDVVNGQENVLTGTRDWVNENMGTGLAGGALKRLFLEPLDEADEFVRSYDLRQYHWNAVQESYSRLADEFPFKPGGDLHADPADEDDVIGLLGGRSGSVQALREIASEDLSDAAEDWLEQALSLSEILFKEGDDKFRSIPVQVTADPPTVEPPKYQQSYQANEIWLSFGRGDEIREAPEDVMAAPIPIKLFGETRSTRSFLSITLAERKGAFARGFSKKNYREGTSHRVENVVGAWAPVVLFSNGLPEGRPGGNKVQVAYPLEVQVDKKNMVTVQISLEVEAAGLGRLIELVRYGFPPPPPDPFGSE